MKKPISTILKSDQYSRKIGIESKERRREWEERNRDQLIASSVLFDRKVEIVTEGLIPFFSKIMNELSRDNAMTIADYIAAMKTEINPSQNYRKETLRVLCQLSKYIVNKPFKSVTREDIIEYLDSFRKPEGSDPLHKWIGTYNVYRIRLMRFFNMVFYSFQSFLHCNYVLPWTYISLMFCIYVTIEMFFLNVFLANKTFHSIPA